MCYHAEFGRSALKSVDINTGNPQNCAALELRYLRMGGAADPNIHAPALHVLPGQIWSFCDKRCEQKIKVNRGVTDVTDNLKQAHPRICYHVKIW